MDEFVESPIGKIPKKMIIDEYSLLMNNNKLYMALEDDYVIHASSDGSYIEYTWPYEIKNIITM